MGGTRDQGWGPKSVPARAWLAAVVALGMVACAQERTDLTLGPEPGAAGEVDADAEAGGSSAAGAEAMEIAWSSDGHFATRPAEVAGTLVTLQADQGGLSLLAIDPATGAELWRRPSTASSITAGVAYALVTGDDRVYHLAPAGSGDEEAAVVEAVDAASGEVAWVTEESPGGFLDPLEFCDSDALCVTAASESTAAPWAVDVATGDLVGPAGLRAAALVPPPGSDDEAPEPAEPTDEQRRSLGGDLYDLLDSRDIARIVDGEVMWQKSPSELFDGQPVSPDFGWQVREQGDQLVVWLGSRTSRGDGDHDLPTQYTAGIDVATGDTRWISEGATALCFRLVGMALVPVDSRWVRCLTTGTLTVADDEIVGWDLDSRIEEFDADTGEAEWSVDLGPSSALGDDSLALVRLSALRFALVRDDGTTVGVDLGQGEEFDPDENQVGWCESANQYEYARSNFGYRVGDSFATPCSLASPQLQAPAEADLAMGVSVADMFVWMDAAGLHGARSR